MSLRISPVMPRRYVACLNAQGDERAGGEQAAEHQKERAPINVPRLARTGPESERPPRTGTPRFPRGSTQAPEPLHERLPVVRIFDPLSAASRSGLYSQHSRGRTVRMGPHEAANPRPCCAANIAVTDEAAGRARIS